MKEENEFKKEMMKIEAAALSSFQKDLASDPTRAKELPTKSFLVTDLSQASSSTSVTNRGRFGEDLSAEESMTLVKGREKALDTVAKKLEKKFKWLERKTAEGQIFYFNRETFESSREKPKDGFVPLSEQDGTEYDVQEPSSTEVPSWQSSIPDPFGRWESVKTKEEIEGEAVDLQLPKNEDDDPPVVPEKLLEAKAAVKKEPITFTEKTLDKPMSSKTNIEFKKRKLNDNTKKNVRRRNDD